MNIFEVMTKTVVTVEMDDTLAMVKEIFDNTQFHHLMVVESGKLFGIVSDRDLLKTLSPHIGTVRETAQDVASLNKKVHQIMTRQPVSLKSNASVADAINIFNAHKISCIPVVDEKHKPVGILSWRDIFKQIANNNGGNH